MTIHKSWLWSDSTIVLSWIRRQPRDSRLAEINELNHQHEWLHVLSKENPADCITRGTSNELNQCSLWWHGPRWLIQPQHSWPAQPKLVSSDTAEVKRCHVTIVENSLNQSVLIKHSSYLKTLRVMSYVHRFIHNAKLQIVHLNSVDLFLPQN